MSDADDSSDEPSRRTDSTETVEEIMTATYRALSSHGYPGTTMARIAAEFPKSKSLLYYHYDGKDDLLTDFFAYLCDRLEADLTDRHHDDEPVDQLLELIGRILPSPAEPEQFQFRQAYFEIRSQAPHNEAYLEQISRSDRLVLEALRTNIAAGVEAGVYREVDPSVHAELLFSTLVGIMERGVTLEDRETVERNRAALIESIESELFVDSTA